MEQLYFGTGGVPHSARDPTSISGIERIAELKLGAMELEFVQRVSMGEAGARLVADVAKRLDIKLSVHAPYYINLNAREPEKLKASQARLLQAAHIGWLCGARSVVFHPGFYLGDSPEQVYPAIKTNLAVVVNQLRREGNKITVRPEVMGRSSQFGTIDEVVRLSLELDGVAPCIDFAHWHARTGVSNSYAEFLSMLETIEKGLGRPALDDIHIHVSGIHYGARGELNHLDMPDSDFNYRDFLRALKDCQVKGLVICESPNLEGDAQLLQSAYNSL